MDKELKIIEQLKTRVDDTTPVDPFAGYVTLMLSLLKEPFVSSISKYFIISNSYEYLKEIGYSEEQMEIYKQRVSKIIKENIEINSFMG